MEFALADFGDLAGAVAEVVGWHVHFLDHRKEEITESGVGVHGAVADGVVLSVVVELIGIAFWTAEVIVIDVMTVSDAEGLSAGEHKRKFGVSVSVSVSHAAAVKAHGTVEQQTIRVLDFGDGGIKPPMASATNEKSEIKLNFIVVFLGEMYSNKTKMSGVGLTPFLSCEF